MKYQDKQLDEIFDLTAIRIIVDTVKDCYAVLGLVHTRWKPIPGRFKDYIAMPKTNRYQSLHTTVIGDDGNPFEIQIRTIEMHKIAEYGIAAHWKYKEGIEEDKEEGKLAWLRQTLEWQQDLNDSKEFMETVKVDLFSNQVKDEVLNNNIYVFTPKGDVIELPAGSTPLDFAFKIHTAIGAKCVGAKVNGKMVPIDYILKNGEIIEIVTSSNSKGPSIDWLRIVKSNAARNKIRSYLKKENKSDNIEKGKDMLEKYIRRKGYDTQQIIRNQWIIKAAKALNFATADELYTSISYGGAILSKVTTQLQKYYQEEKQLELKKIEKEEARLAEKPKIKEPPKNSVTVEGIDDLYVRFAKCCNPVLGDEIIGFITKGRGLSVHRADCINILSLPEQEKPRLIKVDWNKKNGTNASYDVNIQLLAQDRKGLFSDISRVCEDMDVHITGVNAKSGVDEVVNITMTVSLSDTGQLENVIRRLRTVPGVTDAYRGNL